MDADEPKVSHLEFSLLIFIFRDLKKRLEVQAIVEHYGVDEGMICGGVKIETHRKGQNYAIDNVLLVKLPQGCLVMISSLIVDFSLEADIHTISYVELQGQMVIDFQNFSQLLHDHPPIVIYKGYRYYNQN